MKFDVQSMVDKVFERRSVDKFLPVTQYEYKQREGRHMMDMAQMSDKVKKMEDALAAHDIEVEEAATDEEIITAMLTEEQNFQHQQSVNNYNERVERYQDGSLLERVRIMFEGRPEKPQKNPITDPSFYEEEKTFDVEESLSEEEMDEIESILSNVDEGDISRIQEEGKTNDAAKLADEVKEMLQRNDTAQASMTPS